MIMAAGTSKSQSQKHGGCRINAIHHVLNGVLFRDNAPFRVATMVAIKSSGDHLAASGIGDQVASQLFR